MALDWLRSYTMKDDRQSALPLEKPSTEERKRQALVLVEQLAHDARFSKEDQDSLKLAATIIAEARLCEVYNPKVVSLKDHGEQ